MEYFHIAILFSLFYFASTVKYFPGYQQACVKENDINNFVEEMCQIVAANETDITAMKDKFTDDAIFTFMNQPAIKIKDYFDVLFKFNEALCEYYNISMDKVCSPDIYKYNVYGCEHNENPSFIKGQWNFKGKDREHSLESNYYQEVVYDGGKLKISKSTISSTMTADVFKKLTKNIKDEIPFILISPKNSLDDSPVPVVSSTNIKKGLYDKEKYYPLPVTSSSTVKKGLQDKDDDSPVLVTSSTNIKAELHDKRKKSPLSVTSTTKGKEKLQDKDKDSLQPVPSSTKVKQGLPDQDDSSAPVTPSTKKNVELQNKKKNSPVSVTSSTIVTEEPQDEDKDSSLPVTSSTKKKEELQDKKKNSPVSVTSSTILTEEPQDEEIDFLEPVTSSTTVKKETQNREKEKSPESEDYEDNNSTTALSSSEITSQSPEPSVENKDECEEDNSKDA